VLAQKSLEESGTQKKFTTIKTGETKIHSKKEQKILNFQKILLKFDNHATEKQPNETIFSPFSPRTCSNPVGPTAQTKGD